VAHGFQSRLKRTASHGNHGGRFPPGKKQGSWKKGTRFLGGIKLDTNIAEKKIEG